MKLRPSEEELAEHLQESSEVAQDAKQLDGAEIDVEIAELSPELAAMQNGAAVDESLEDTQEFKQTEVNKIDLLRAEKMALNALAPIFATVQAITGKSYNLDEKAAIALSKGIAPCLAKYKLIDPSDFMEKWGEEIQAIIAIGSLGFGVYQAHKAYQLEAEMAKQAPEKEAA